MSDTTDFGYQSIPINTKTSRVAEVFHSVAKKYDFMNDLMSFGMHRVWKRIAIAKALINEDHKILDLACGSGDLSCLLAKKIKQPGKLILSDINPSMLNIARNRLIDLGYGCLDYIQNNAESLPFPENYFDRILISFGLRNITYKEKALSEMFRVLKCGGRVVILEFSHPESMSLKNIYDLYSFNVIPKMGKIVCNDEQSYRYLAESIRMHPNQEDLKKLMIDAQFQSVQYQNILNGIVAIHTGFKF